MNFDESISYQLAKVSTAHRNALERAMSAAGLHSGQVFVMFELWKTDGVRQVDLAARLNVSPPTVNKMLKILIDKGLVTRSKVEGDSRSTRIFLTDEGAAIREAVEMQWLDLESDLLSPLTETERLVLGELLNKLRRIDTDEDE